MQLAQWTFWIIFQKIFNMYLIHIPCIIDIIFLLFSTSNHFQDFKKPHNFMNNFITKSSYEINLGDDFLQAFYCSFILSNRPVTRLRTPSHKWEYYNKIQKMWFMAWYTWNIITREFTDMIFCLYFSWKYFSFHALFAYFPNISAKWRQWLSAKDSESLFEKGLAKNACNYEKENFDIT